MTRSLSVGCVFAALAAVVCTSARTALLLMALTALTTLFTLTLRSLLLWLRLPLTSVLTVLFATAVGGAVYWCLLAYLDGEILGSAPLVLTLCALCGAVEESSLSASALFRLCAALLVLGAARECLATATLFQYPLPFSAMGTAFGKTPSGEIGIGGILLAAIVLWGFRFHSPVGAVSLPFDTIWPLGLLTTAVCVLSQVLPIPSSVWRFWLCLLITAIVWSFSPTPPTAWLIPVPALAASLLGVGRPLWYAVVVAAAVVASTLAANAVSVRLSHSPQRTTVSSLLCSVAVALAALKSI